MPSANVRPGRERMKAYRERLRAQGLKPVQVWVPDRDAAEFKDRLHRDAERIAKSDGERLYVEGLASDVDELDWPYDG